MPGIEQYAMRAFADALEDIPMADSNLAATLTTTRFRRPVLEDNVVNAKAGCFISVSSTHLTVLYTVLSLIS